MAWMRTEINLPEGFDTEDSQELADEILSYILDRTKKGEGMDGKKFAGYSNSYANSFDFKVAGKSKNKVNLTLSSEMLDSLEVLSASSKKIVIGFEKGNEEINGRAEGNILGTYGQSSPIAGKARNFLELSSKEVANIIQKLDLVPKDIRREINQVSGDLANQIVKKFDFSFGEDDG